MNIPFQIVLLYIFYWTGDVMYSYSEYKWNIYKLIGEENINMLLEVIQYYRRVETAGTK